MKKSEKFLLFFILTFVLTMLLFGIINFFFGVMNDWSWNIALSLGNATGNAVINTFIIKDEE